MKDVKFQFMYDWVVSPESSSIPDLVEFRNIWEDAQRNNISDYKEYKKFKGDKLVFESLKENNGVNN